jgi:pimeloyl-ACP methyl ester carboxylesterase
MAKSRFSSRLCYAILVMLVAVTTVVFPEAAPARAEDDVPRFEESRCRFPLPESYKVRCGNLIVPEDRSNPESRTIKLHVAIVSAKSRTPAPDPVVYLDGGPGGHTLMTMHILLPEYFAKYAAKRDFILFDQRGVGLSEPALECTELNFSTVDQLRRVMTQAEVNQERNALLKRCHDRLVRQGINLASYNSNENAADLNDLRLALGYEQWNLYGISYGTRLALTAMRDFPEGIRSVVLDSAYPPNAALYTDIPGNASRSFKALFDGCRQDTRCNRTFPKLEQEFYKLVDDLNLNPAVSSITVRGRRYRIVITGNRMMDTLFDMMYSTRTIPYLPRLIWDVKEGNYDDLARRLLEANIGTRSSVSTGMYYSVQCREEVSFSTQEELDQADAAYPEQFGAFSTSNIYQICQNWKIGAAPEVENLPVVSNIPTLVMAGQFDPITPPSYGALAAESLNRVYFFEFPGIGHGVSVAGVCPTSIMQAFLNDPLRKPNSACIRRMAGPDFVTW